MQQSDLLNPSKRTELRLSVCGGKQPRLSIGIPRAIAEALGANRATVEVDEAGRLRVHVGAAGRYAVLASGPHFGCFQIPADLAPFPCTSERRAAVMVPATIEGDTLTATEPLPALLYRDGRRPSPTAPLEELRARLVWINDQIAARRQSGAAVVEPVIRDGQIRLRVVEEVIL
jgi:hypothetical protein